MKLKFSWCNTPAGPIAVCESDVLDSNGISALSCLLMDDGGLDLCTSSAWIREGIDRAQTVLAGATDARLIWDREDWGAELMNVQTTIYSLHEEHVSQTILTSDFRRVLVDWLKFVEQNEATEVENDIKLISCMDNNKASRE